MRWLLTNTLESNCFANYFGVWSHLYSFSFEGSDWTREFSDQEEIHAYLVRVAEKWGLYKYIRFNTAVDEARWNDKALKWETAVTVANGSKDAESSSSYVITSDYLVSAVGQLNAPFIPDILGLRSFKGKLIHSSRWDHTYNYEGKRVAVIGNGATAAQIIPEVAKQARALTVFQRTANWIIPREDAEIPQWRRSIYRLLPWARKRYRAELMDIREGMLYNIIVTGDAAGKDLLRSMNKELINKQIPNNPELIEKLTPDYPPGCKRIIISDDFFEAMNKSHISLETGKIEKITENGIVAGGNEYDFDMIIMATGFRTVDFMFPIKVFGLNERSIHDIWRDGAQAYYGMTVESLPNFAMLYGPNTNLGHNSIILMIETQSRYITELISQVCKAKSIGKTLVISPKVEPLKQHNHELQQKLALSTYASSSCKSWYKLDNGLITNNWSGTVIDYQKQTSTIEWDNFDIDGNYADELRDANKNYIGRIQEETFIGRLGLGILVLMASSAVFYALRNVHVAR
jgi:cation diffusion facilitator CzcD-associated flavoprotein CzcO